MSEDESKIEPESVDTKAGGRNPIIIFLGFTLLGVALALLLFGGDLFGSSQTRDEEANPTLLNQVSAFPTSEASIAQIPSRGLSGEILDVGDQAYEFTLNDLDGNPVSLVDFRGQPVIVNFWATWCAPCRIEMPELQAAFDKYQDDGLVILALDQSEPVEVAREFFYDEMNLTFTPLLDDNSVIATAYGSYSVLPTSYFIDSEGLVAAVHRGPMTLSQIDGYITELIDGSQS